MHHSYLADFHRGWIIEVVRDGDGFRSTCYSSAREHFSDNTIYPSESQAIGTAKRTIDRYIACYLLSSFLRDMYELGNLSFEEWSTLNQSLMKGAIATP